MTKTRFATAGLLALSALLASVAQAQQPEKRPADFIREKTAVPEGASETAFKRGTSQERQARLSKLGAAYEANFDLSGLPAYRPATHVTGKLRVWGNNYIWNSGVAQAWSTEFRKHHPGLEVELVLPTAAMAVGSLNFGVADVAMTHEPTFYDSLSHLRIYGFEPVSFMAITGSFDISGWMNTMAIAVHKDMPINAITMEQLDGVFGSQRQGGWDGTTWHGDYARGPEKNIRTWRQLGVGGACADKPIVPIGYAVIYSTAIEFSRRVLRSSGRWNEDLRDFGNSTYPDGSNYSQYQRILDELAKEPCGMAIVRNQKAFPTDKYKLLSLGWDSKSPPVPFTRENVFNRSYPLSGEMSFFASVKPGDKMDPKIKEWMSFILSRDAQNLVQTVDRKYLPLNARVVADERARLAGY